MAKTGKRGAGSDCLPAAQGPARGQDVMNMEKKKGIMLVIAPDAMRRYFEGAEEDGSDESKLGEVIEKCAEFPEQTQMSTATQALIFALQKAKTIDGERLKKFLDHAKIIDVERMRNAGIKKLKRRFECAPNAEEQPIWNGERTARIG